MASYGADFAETLNLTGVHSNSFSGEAGSFSDSYGVLGDIPTKSY